MENVIPIISSVGIRKRYLCIVGTAPRKSLRTKLYTSTLQLSYVSAYVKFATDHRSGLLDKMAVVDPISAPHLIVFRPRERIPQRSLNCFCDVVRSNV